MKTFKDFLITEDVQSKLNYLQQKHGLTPEHLGHIKATDPTPHGEYIKRIGEWSTKGHIKLPEDSEKIHGQLKQFHSLKNSPNLPKELKDIGKHTPATLYDTLQHHTPSHKETIRNEKVEGSDLIAKEGDYEVHKIDPEKHGMDKAVKALRHHSSGTNWCTAHKGHAKNYLEQGPSHIMYHKGGRVAQLHVGTNSFHNVSDKPLLDTDIGVHTLTKNMNEHHKNLLHLAAKHDPDVKHFVSNIADADLPKQHIKNDSGEFHLKHGLYHRDDDKPAVEFSGGNKAWYQNGQRHREGDKPAIVNSTGKVWFKNNQPHRDDDKPAMELSNGDKEWYKNGKRHREGDKPAVENANGDKEWHKNGKLHREGDKPAVELSNGDKEWHKNGNLHREGDKPAAIMSSNYMGWYKKGKLHREGGKPAVIYHSGNKEWFENGERVDQIGEDN